MARLTRMICGADPGGSVDAVDALVDAAERHDAQAVAVVGDLIGPDQGPDAYRAVFRALAPGDRPAFWVPGPGDAPLGRYLREAHNIEVVHPQLHGVHGTAALAPGEVVVAGLGGDISDDPDATRDENDGLAYPRWEAEYRLKILREWPEHERVLLFHTHPAHKGLGTPGSEAVAELVGTYRARVVVCGGERGTELIGRSLVVSPGSLRSGQYAVVDVQKREAQLTELAGAR
jgi:Icc-related predicted phosphoesterase